MIKPSCSKSRRLILESEGGRIESADALWLESHIQACKTCRDESRELAALLGAWKSLAPPRLSAGRLERIEQAVLEADVTASVARRSPRTWKVPTIAAAIAAAMAVISLGVFWSKRQPAPRPPTPGNLLASTVAPRTQTARVTHGALHVYGPTGDTRVVRDSMLAPWNTPLQAPASAGGVVALGPHATLGLAPGAQVALRRHGADTVVALIHGTIAVDARIPGTHQTGRFRVWIPGRGEVATRGARLVVARDASGVAISAVRGWARYGWTLGGTPMVAELEAGERLTHRLDTVNHGAGPPTTSAGGLLAGRVPSTAPTKRRRIGPFAPDRPDKADALANRAHCAIQPIRQALTRRDAMGAVRTLEACRAAGQTSRALRALEARANLQAGRVRRALNQYLAVAHSYQGSQDGQAALYSAGRIALTRLARKSQAKRLFEHYMQTYPRGSHRANVRQMLRTL